MRQASLILSIGAMVVTSMSAYGQAADSDDSSTAKATSASDSSDVLGEIVVTARKREESLEKVPIAVTAVNLETLAIAAIRTTEDLGRSVPGLIVSDQSGAASPVIRGVGQIAGDPGFEPAVATYVDGVYIGSNYASKVSLTDVERVDVLKGPQGTLFGRNSVGGLINIVTRTPQQTPYAEDKITYGNYDTITNDFYATGGLAENLAASLSGSYWDRHGGPGTSAFDGKPTYTGRDETFRAKLRYLPTDTTTVTLAGDYRYLDTLDGVSANLFNFPGNILINGTTGPLPNYYDNLGQGQLNVSDWGVSLKLDQELPVFDLMSLTAYRYERDFHRRRLDLEPDPAAPLLGDFSWNPTYKTVSEELQFNSKPSSAIKWVAGVFLLRDRTGYADGQEFRIFGPIIGGNFAYANAFHTNSNAVFAETTIPLPSSTNITLGARYTSDKRSLGGHLNVYGDVGSPVTANNLPLLAVVPESSNSHTWKTPTWRAMIDHELFANNMVYASYSRGFKAGNIVDTNTSQMYNPERLDAYEVGFKGEPTAFLRTNLAAFYYKYGDQQVTYFSTAGAVASNAASSRIYGGELEVDVVPVRNFKIHSGFSVLHAKFDAYRGATCVEPNFVAGLTQISCDASGHWMTRSPRFTATLEPNLTLPSKVGAFNLSASFYYSDKYYADVGNFESQEPLKLLSSRITWTPAHGPYTLGIFGANLTSQKYWTFANPAFSGYYYSAAMPRTYGVELTMSFGQ